VELVVRMRGGGVGRQGKKGRSDGKEGIKV
jgi:hypothetical protein